MQEIANLRFWGLKQQILNVVQLDEGDNPKEEFDLRIFVAPQEFFTLGLGRDWGPVINCPGTVLYNVDQPQSSWFCRALPLLLRVPLVLDIKFPVRGNFAPYRLQCHSLDAGLYSSNALCASLY